MKEQSYILAIDDDSAILEYYKNIFSPEISAADLSIDKLNELFEIGEVSKSVNSKEFEVICVDDGVRGIGIYKDLFEKGEEAGVCIIDMRMPAGIDGFECAKRLRKINPDVYILIVTAYSDKTIHQMRETLKDNIFFLRKPFSEDEIYQMVFSLNKNYKIQRELKVLNKNLEKKVQAGIESNRQKDALLIKHSSFAAMKNTLYYMSHYWRQPLSAISLVCQNIQMELDDGIVDNSQIMESTNLVIDTVTDLSKQINFFGEVFTSGGVKTFRVDEALRLLEKFFLPLEMGETVELQFDLEDNIIVKNYRSELLMIAMHVLNNCVTNFNLRHVVKPVVKISMRKIESLDKVVIAIEDNGGGIEEEIMKKLFKGYIKTNAGQEASLFMIKALLRESMDGDITAKNTSNGVRFEITIGNFRDYQEGGTIL